MELLMRNVDGKNLENVTHEETFDAFPVFTGNRNNGGTRDTNLFITGWKD